MKRIVFLGLFFAALNGVAQTISSRLGTDIATLEKDRQFEHSILSMYVVETATGKLLFEHNAQIGLAPASCQKVITSASSFEMLGKNYRYKTYIGYDGTVTKGKLNGNLFFTGRGDPTLGSWRWKDVSHEVVVQKILAALKKKGIESIEGSICIDDLNFSYNPIPDGWIWQDIGNYYGAGAWGFNWHENQYDLNLKSTQTIGESTSVVSTSPVDLSKNIVNLVTSAKKGSGDNVYIYAAPYSNEILASGTIPVGENKFTVSGSLPNPPMAFATMIAAALKENNISFNDRVVSSGRAFKNHDPLPKATGILDSLISPSLDSINFWFLKKSINLYGEALVKTIAYDKVNFGSTDSGVAIIRRFWQDKGIDPASLKMMDGSGLSPANRITTKALVSIMQYAKKQLWFASFYNALPEINGIKMKDGYINGVRSYTGYVKSRTGIEYTFSFIVNNFDGNPGTVREKMWKVLDLLK